MKFYTTFGCNVTRYYICEVKKCSRENCGKKFKPTRPKQKYCCTNCRTYAFRERLKSQIPNPLATTK